MVLCVNFLSVGNVSHGRFRKASRWRRKGAPFQESRACAKFLGAISGAKWRETGEWTSVWIEDSTGEGELLCLRSVAELGLDMADAMHLNSGGYDGCSCVCHVRFGSKLVHVQAPYRTREDGGQESRAFVGAILEDCHVARLEVIIPRGIQLSGCSSAIS